MADIIVGLVIIGISAISIGVYRNEKKKGAKCVGCPYSGSNDTNCSCGS